MCWRIPSFSSARLRFWGFLLPHKICRISANVMPSVFLTKYPPSLLSHSRVSPGSAPRSLLTSAGTEIWPCAVILDRGFTPSHYHGNAILARRFHHHRRPVAQHFRHPVHHFRRVIPDPDDRVRPHLRRVLDHQFVRVLASLFA